MEIIVNGKLENLDYIIESGENIASDIILNNEERLSKDQSTGLYQMSRSQFEYWQRQIDILQKTNRLEEIIKENGLYDEFYQNFECNPFLYQDFEEELSSRYEEVFNFLKEKNLID